MGALLLLPMLLLQPSSAFNSIDSFSTIRPSLNRAPSSSSVCVNLAASSPKNARSNHPGSELFPDKGSSYVPYGLTEKQYKQIKADEEKKKSKMNFGAWGPRFAEESEAPSGDWMVMPSLWTQGFGSRKPAQGAAAMNNEPAGDVAGNNSNNWGNKIASLRRHAPAYLVSYLIIDAILVAFSLARAAKLSSSESILALTLKMMLWRKQMLFLSIWKVKLLEITAAFCLLRPIEALVERTNRRWLWSPRRTMGAMLMGCVLLLSSWATTLAFLR